MPSTCSVPGCKNKTSSFRFPTEPRLRMQWLVAIKRVQKTLWKPTASALVCDKHFKSDDFKIPIQSFVALGAKPRRLLKADAVPSVFDQSISAMPKYCVVPDCKGRDGFMYPKDPDLRMKWRVAVNRFVRSNCDAGKELWYPYESATVCQRHFKAGTNRCNLTKSIVFST
jgi:hypothetical protein